MRAPFCRWGDLQIARCLFLALWLSYGFICHAPNAGDANAVSRLALTFSLVERHSVTIDDFAPLTEDKAYYDGHYYSDKAPGISLLAAPFIAASAWLFGHPPPLRDRWFTFYYLFANWIACFFTTAAATAWAASMLYRLARHWQFSRDAALFAALCFGLGSPATGWATLFFGHALAGACLFLGFAKLILASETPAVSPRADDVAGFAIGALLAWSVVVEFTAAPAAFVIGCVALARLQALAPERRLRLAGAALLGSLVAAIPLALYNYAAFGSVLHIGYEHVVGFSGMAQGWHGVSLPRPHVLYEIIFGPYRGVLWVAPVLALAPLGYWAAFRKLPRDAAMTLLVVPALFVLINGGYVYWNGGGSTGPRHLVPGLIFVFVTFAPLWSAATRRLRMALAGFAAVAGFIALACALVDMTASEYIANPVVELILPTLFTGQYHGLMEFDETPPILWLAVLPVIWIFSAGLVSWSARAALLAQSARTTEDEALRQPRRLRLPAEAE